MNTKRINILFWRNIDVVIYVSVIGTWLVYG